MKHSLLAVAVAILTTTNHVWAHPGHGNEQESAIRHVVGSPLHLAEIAAGTLLLIAVTAAWYQLQKRRRQRVRQQS